MPFLNVKHQENLFPVKQKFFTLWQHNLKMESQKIQFSLIVIFKMATIAVTDRDQ